MRVTNAYIRVPTTYINNILSVYKRQVLHKNV